MIRLLLTALPLGLLLSGCLDERTPIAPTPKRQLSIKHSYQQVKHLSSLHRK